MQEAATVRQNAEQALRAAHAESEWFINSVPSILIGTDASGRITRWNLAATEVFSLAASTVLGKSLQQCGIQWDDPDVLKEIESWLQIRKGGRHTELRFEKRGQLHFLGLAVTRVSFASQQSGGLLITGADITERRQLEMQLRQSQKLEAVGQLAAGIAHEINTPTQYVGDNTRYIKESWERVSEILQAAKRIDREAQNGSPSVEALSRLHRLLGEGDLDSVMQEVPKAIDQSLEGVQRVADIVRSMRDFSHPGAQEKTELNLNRAIENALTITRNEWKHVAEIETHFDPGLPPVQCHAGEFNQAVLNLIVNAAYAIRQSLGDGSQKKGRITISTRHDCGFVEIAIEDTGCGIPEAIRPRIFEPFFTTKPVGHGTGQGLALAHASIVRRNGGRLWFESIPGKGTTFFIRLPISGTDSGS